MPGYAFNFNGRGVFTPDGKVDIAPTETDTHNRETEQKEILWLRTGPDKCTLYMAHPTSVDNTRYPWRVTTWLGTPLGEAWVGARAHTGFGYHTYRRPVTVRFFGETGLLYHGWYMESSGDYVNLRKAKRQSTKYAASFQE